MAAQRRWRFAVVGSPDDLTARSEAREALAWLGKRLAFEHWLDDVRTRGEFPAPEAHPASA